MMSFNNVPVILHFGLQTIVRKNKVHKINLKKFIGIAVLEKHKLFSIRTYSLFLKNKMTSFDIV